MSPGNAETAGLKQRFVLLFLVCAVSDGFVLVLILFVSLAKNQERKENELSTEQTSGAFLHLTGWLVNDL